MSTIKKTIEEIKIEEQVDIKKPVKAVKKEVYIYVGETVANHKINIIKNSIIKDLKSYEKLFKKIPGLKKLFIKLSDYPEIKMRMKEATSPINKRIEEVGKLMREVKNV